MMSSASAEQSNYSDACHSLRADTASGLQLSHGNPVAAVCSRGDLEGPDAVATGCFDTKVTSYTMALQLHVDAVAGPTTQVRSLPWAPAVACTLPEAEPSALSDPATRHLSRDAPI